MSAAMKERAREIIERLAKLDKSKRPSGGVHGQVIGMEPYVIRTTGDGLQCLFDAQVLLDELLDPFNRRPTQCELSALPELPKPDTHCFDEDTKSDVWSHSQDQTLAYGLLCRQSGDAADKRDAWQPIETAPKDLAQRLYRVNGFCVQGFVDATGVLMAQTEIPPHWRKMRGKPTHWMPRPAPPAAIAQRQEGGNADQT